MLIVIGALLETMGVSIIIPLVSAVVSPDTILDNGMFKSVTGMLNISITDSDTFVKLLLAATAAIFIIKNLFMLLMYYSQARVLSRLESTTSVRLYNEYLNRDYEYYLNADINAIFQTVNKDIPHVFELLKEVLLLLTEVIVSLFMCILLLIVDFKMTMCIAAMLVLMVLIIILVIKPTLGNLGQQRVKQQAKTMKWMQQGVFGIKDVKVATKEQYFLKNFDRAYTNLAGVERRYNVYNNAPKLFIETACILGLVGYMFICICQGRNMMGLLPELTAFGLAAVRLMPSFNRISTHLSTIAYFESSLNFICDNIKVSELREVRFAEGGAEKLEMDRGIEVRGITYAYPNTDRFIFDNASMSIPVGASVGVMGPSGAGKTTIIDILLGLLQPSQGSVEVDGIDIRENYAGWLGNVGYIPQNIYMLDSTIKENVAFGVDEQDIDEDRVWEVLKEAQLDTYIRSLPEGIDTDIGDRGIRISGGQRQRIGIARALYHNPEVLVFDEATSALDNDTEAAIMEAINSLKGRKTMVIIAHRLKTIENCDYVYKVENGKIEKTTLNTIN